MKSLKEALVHKHLDHETQSSIFKDKNSVYIIWPSTTTCVDEILDHIDPNDINEATIGIVTLGNDDVVFLIVGKNYKKLHTSKPIYCDIWSTYNGYISTVRSDINDLDIYNTVGFGRYPDYFEKVYSGKIKF